MWSGKASFRGVGRARYTFDSFLIKIIFDNTVLSLVIDISNYVLV